MKTLTGNTGGGLLRGVFRIESLMVEQKRAYVQLHRGHKSRGEKGESVSGPRSNAE